MLNFDFGECLNEVDYRYIEKKVEGFTQAEMESMLNICEGQVKYPQDLFDYEVEEAKLYIELIQERYLNMTSSELVAI
jgi:hypothetical protein